LATKLAPGRGQLNWGLANSLGAANNGGRLRGEVATATVAEPAQWTPYGGAIITQAELPKVVHESVRCRLVKQEWESDLFHIFDLEDRSEHSASRFVRKLDLHTWKLRSHPETEMALPSI